MKEDRYNAGHVIYREGDPGDAVYIIKDGEIEVLRDVSGEEVRLAVLHKGAIFGEMGVLQDKPRSTTTRTLGDTTLVTITKEIFLSTFQKDNPLALPLLRMLCERLSQADSQLVKQQIYSEGARADEVAGIHLLPDSPEMKAAIGAHGVEVGNLPFRVGRQPRPGDPANADKAELSLQSPGGEQISPQHFGIEALDGRLIVRDLGSHLGTQVNGSRVASFEQSESADLLFGENSVQTGGLESAYRFSIIVERAAD